MSMRNPLVSAIQFLMVMALLVVGLFFIALPSAPALRFELAAFLMNREGLFLPLGLMIIAVSVALLVGIYWLDHKSYFQVSLKGASDLVSVDKELIRTNFVTYWKRLFPEEALEVDVVIHKDDQIELVAEIPSLDEESQQKTFVRVEKEMGLLLEKQLGYRKEFLLTLVLK